MLEKGPQSLLISTPFFSDLSEDDALALINAGTVKNYEKNETLFFHADRAEKFFIVISGCVKIHSQTETGEGAILALLTTGKTVGEASIFDGAIYPYSASAAEKSKILVLSASILKDRAKVSLSLTQKIMNIISEEVLDLQKEKEHFSVMSTAQRVGCMLLKLSGNMIGKGGTFTLPYDKSLAASNLGMKPETFSRALKELKNYGVNVKGPEVSIENFEILSHFCCVQCSSMGGSCNGDKS